jgi:hypothetical protein
MKKFNNCYNLSDYATHDKQAFRLREDESKKRRRKNKKGVTK